MNTASFVTKGLRFRPYRTLFLLLGFAVGVMVMTVLLSVGSAVLDQALDEDLTGGGDVVLLPVGIDVDVLKTGGVTSMHFDIPNARYLTREFFTPRRVPALRTVSPELTRTYATLEHDGREQLVRIDGVVPSRFAALWPAMPAAFTDGEGERRYVDPDFVALLMEIDAFHAPVIDSAQTWAEWHYFNYHDAAGRSLYVSINALAFEDDVAPSGYSRGMVLFQYVDESGQRTRILDVLPGREIAASTASPDLLVGLNVVRLDGGVYRVNVALSDSTGRPVSAALDLEPTPHQYVPPITPMGSETAFGYVVPVVRGRMSGRVTVGGRAIELDGIGYHDHNWGHFRDAVWDWGIVHLGETSVLYGRFARSADVLAREPVLFALFDAGGPRPFVLTHDYNVLWKRAGAARPAPPPRRRIPVEAPRDSAGDTTAVGAADEPAVVVLRAKSGTDDLELRIDVQRRFVSETGGGEQPLFRADEEARSFFIQMEGRARLTGTLSGARVELTGHAYAETFRIHR
jgi:hypothetical protein